MVQVNKVHYIHTTTIAIPRNLRTPATRRVNIMYDNGPPAAATTTTTILYYTDCSVLRYTHVSPLHGTPYRQQPQKPWFSIRSRQNTQTGVSPLTTCQSQQAGRRHPVPPRRLTLRNISWSSPASSADASSVAVTGEAATSFSLSFMFAFNIATTTTTVTTNTEQQHYRDTTVSVDNSVAPSTRQFFKTHIEHETCY